VYLSCVVYLVRFGRWLFFFILNLAANIAYARRYSVFRAFCCFFLVYCVEGGCVWLVLVVGMVFFWLLRRCILYVVRLSALFFVVLFCFLCWVWGIDDLFV